MKRPPTQAEISIVEHREKLSVLPLDERFRYIYQHNMWNGTESVSGPGSSLAATETIRKHLPGLLRTLKAKSILDIPCGDANWISNIKLPLRYIGADIVSELIERNQAKFPNLTFVKLDLLEDTLPSVDVIFIRDCLVHLSNSNIQRAFQNIIKAKPKFIIMTTFTEHDANIDIMDGAWRPINFTKPPFSLPEPSIVLNENCIEIGGAYQDKSLGVWKLKDLPKKKKGILVPVDKNTGHVAHYTNPKHTCDANIARYRAELAAGYTPPRPGEWHPHHMHTKEEWQQYLEQRIADNDYDWRENWEFEDTLEMCGYSRGRAAAYFHLQSKTTGIQYCMFMTDLTDVIKNCVIDKGIVTGIWTYVKRGMNYGIKLVKSDD